MYAGEVFTAPPASYDTYLSSTSSRSELSSINSGRPVIGSLPEEDEEDHPGRRKPDVYTLSNDSTRLLSASSTNNGLNVTGQSHTSSPQPIPSSSPQPKSLSASPAAMFLSCFTSPVIPSPKPDDEGQVISGYTLGGIIGYGGTSVIRRATSSSGAISAVKIIRRSDLVKAGNAPQARKRLHHEATVWASLSHEHILPLFSAVHTTYADYFFTLYCPAGSLFDILKRDGNPALPQDDVGMMFRQIVRGLRYLHEVAGYVHRDIKPENILVDEMGVCKISDFGMSRKIGSLEDEDEEEEDHHEFDGFSGGNSLHRAVSLATTPNRRHTNAFPTNHHIYRHNTTRHRNSTSTNEPSHFQPGSLPYAAPELLLTQTSEALRPHPGQDIWALGVTLYTLLTGFLPFSDSFEPRLHMKILNGAYEVPHGIGRGAERILEGCLDRSLANRWTIAMVDEIAWGVGWGSEGDDATPSELVEDITKSNSLPVESRSRSRSRPGNVTTSASSDFIQGEPPSRPSLATASRRSSSRVQRSLSRAPILTDRSTSARSASRSMSRCAQGSSPHASTSTESQLSEIASSAPPSPDPYDAVFNGSALDLSSSSSPVERGRRQNKPAYVNSRSPSPSMVPPTPMDGPSAIESDSLLEHPDELHLDPESSSRPEKMDEPTQDKDMQYDQETDEWSFDASFESTFTSQERQRHGRGRDPIASVLVGPPDRLVKFEANWRQRPSSSPPITPRSPAESSSQAQVDSFLNASTLPSTTKVFRRRSADRPRRQV